MLHHHLKESCSGATFGPWIIYPQELFLCHTFPKLWNVIQCLTKWFVTNIFVAPLALWTDIDGKSWVGNSRILLALCNIDQGLRAFGWLWVEIIGKIIHKKQS
jgi:hypothetical protein